MALINPVDELVLQAAFLPGEEGLKAWLCLKNQYTIDDISSDAIPLIYRNLSALLVEDDLYGRLKGCYRYQWTKNQFLLKEIAARLSVLNESRIDIIVLGNCALSYAYYEDWGSREVVNFELATHREHSAAAAALLEKSDSNFHLPNRSGIIFPSLKTKTFVELEFTGNENIWNHCISINILNIPTLILDSIDQFFYLILQDEWYSTIMWLADLMTIISSTQFDIDWSMRRAENYGITSVLKDRIDFVFSLFSSKIDMPAMIKLANLGLM